MLKSMIKFRTYHSLTGTMYSEFLYATGGIYKNNTLKTVERYDRRKNKWSELNSMIVKRSHHASSLLN